jgi:hypothetical protein
MLPGSLFHRRQMLPAVLASTSISARSQYRQKARRPVRSSIGLMKVSLGMLDLLTFLGSRNDLIILRVRFLQEIAPQVELESTALSNSRENPV